MVCTLETSFITKKLVAFLIVGAPLLVYILSSEYKRIKVQYDVTISLPYHLTLCPFRPQYV